MSDCLFCNIVKGAIRANKVYEDENVLAFEDINPQAPVHLLIIPKKHIPTINDIEESDKALIGELVIVGKKLAKEKGLADDGYRLVINCNKSAGQLVFHIHVHLLGGRKLDWPPG
ncbi:MAG: histidine triad nucleotide-binding protein [Candidatus Margulisiibacteriota bacterium]|nr:MAG: histidine triad nucleotide-binding protein [Candidatus Margulisbacteria bacterium GWD2_39_127]OGI03595.1 MAG: histidine triad nucleotide-binding protein [Candidatus Margulisbacteria bacterium GWF2_38_17]OGI11099.1 MAG: histidine triad nucleotide-binding protein [Candidatus Margulisbacteria bacterium GWE2_39_32]PZM78153.1 MAG: histidine triad nucleotide-binding protein [Candidatus Margulisiibacteriota bacterium]HAR62301.1 histidine triad nucleotide-binding protein [Candidatus Margulisiib